ncbi:MAG: UDP-3-O-(3-hydroxymyristoyl)glucosamine N-acyltransferase [Planctomycetota bacterium]|nr:MAG: UDP-3-O-(3-hydroxymyristoyl)glucosamine N-acyltransferase [Planctomycetota bacterium]
MTPRTLSELAELTGSDLVGFGDRFVTGPASLRHAKDGEISFLVERRHSAELETTHASAVVVGEEIETSRTDLTLLRSKDPGRAFGEIVLAFAPEEVPVAAGVHPTAVVDPSAQLSTGVCIGPLCVIGRDAHLGTGSVLHPAVVVGARARIGVETVLHPGVVIYAHSTVGARCVIHAGAVLGSDGFGFEASREGWDKIPQCGTVVVEDDVEIGANVTIDCARFGATRIGRGVKIDNLVHIGHNVQVGEAAMLVAQVGVAGSSRIGKRAILAGQAGIAGHIEVGDGARVGGGSAVFKDVAPGEDVFGVPASRKSAHLRTLARQRRLGALFDDFRRLARRVAELEEERR